MSANHSLYVPSASASSNDENGVTNQCHALPISRRNSFDMVIAVANDRAAANSQNDDIGQESAIAIDESSLSSSDRESCTPRSRRSKPFDLESQTGAYEDVDLQERWPTASRLGLAGMNSSIATLRTSDAAATAAAFQAQASSGKRTCSLWPDWKEWAPCFGL